MEKIMTKKYEEWVFDFVISSTTDEPVTEELPTELLQVILKWCREHGLMAGGGFRPYKSQYVEELEKRIAELEKRD
jgi:hypothetical protein